VVVVDANVVAYALIEGDRTPQARALWQSDPDWRAPRLLRHEVANLVTTAVRTGAMTLETARSVVTTAARLVPDTGPDADIGRVIEIAGALDISAYDACYLATAEALGVRLVTADKRLLRVAPEITQALGNP
jgi:predicted nucleic acid-binding protein